MTRTVWKTRQELDPSFEQAWRTRLSHAAHAHFGFDPVLLQHDAHLGQHAQAVLIDEPDLRAAMVLRETPSGHQSGWPWRWHVVVEDGEGACGVSAEQAEALRAHAREVAGGARVHLFLPHPGGATAFRAGATYMQNLQMDEEAMWKGMNDAKRRMCKRARKRGYEIIAANDHA